MRVGPAVALLVLALPLGIALPACAQRGGSHGGGSHGGGSHGGFTGGSAPAFRGSSGGYRPSAPASGSARFAAGSRFTNGSPRTGYPGRYSNNVRRSFAPGLRASNARPAYGAGTYGANNGSRRHPYSSPYRAGYGAAGFGFVPWIGPDYAGYPDDDGYDDGYAEGSYDPNYGAAPDDAANEEGAPGYPGPGYPGPGYPGPGYPGQGYPGQGYQGQPPIPYQAPPALSRPAAASAPLTMEAVTLVFKDGRPAEHIHNYILTRTTLLILDEHHRDIPVDELDLAATQKANRDSGVDFHLPG
jgi:hypothetical protein